MLTRYGTDNILILISIGILFVLIAYLIDILWSSIVLYSTGGLLILFTLWFFRDPCRNVPAEIEDDDSIILAPADGTIVEIVEEEEPVYLRANSKRISVFLSPLDVHVNRSPVSGRVDYFDYYPGKYLAAYHPKSSELNEHTKIGVNNRYAKVFFKQIVGVLARRIVCELNSGQIIKAGDKIGMMKFGSRMDIAVPDDSEILVHKGQRVVAGITYLCRLKQNGNALL